MASFISGSLKISGGIWLSALAVLLGCATAEYQSLVAGSRGSFRTLYSSSIFYSPVRIAPLLRSFCCFFSPNKPFLWLSLPFLFLSTKLRINYLSKIGLCTIFFHFGKSACKMLVCSLELLQIVRNF